MEYNLHHENHPFLMNLNICHNDHSTDQIERHLCHTKDQLYQAELHSCHQYLFQKHPSLSLYHLDHTEIIQVTLPVLLVPYTAVMSTVQL